MFEIARSNRAPVRRGVLQPVIMMSLILTFRYTTGSPLAPPRTPLAFLTCRSFSRRSTLDFARLVALLDFALPPLLLLAISYFLSFSRRLRTRLERCSA